MSEDEIQKECIKWFKAVYKNKAEITYVANDIPIFDRTVAYQVINKIKSMGYNVGHPDLQIVSFGKMFYVEMKSAKGKLSDNQKNWIARYEKFGFKIYVAHSLEEFQNICMGELG